MMRSNITIVSYESDLFFYFSMYNLFFGKSDFGLFFVCVKHDLKCIASCLRLILFKITAWAVEKCGDVAAKTISPIISDGKRFSLKWTKKFGEKKTVFRLWPCWGFFCFVFLVFFKLVFLPNVGIDCSIFSRRWRPSSILLRFSRGSFEGTGAALAWLLPGGWMKPTVGREETSSTFCHLTFSAIHFFFFFPWNLVFNSVGWRGGALCALCVDRLPSSSCDLSLCYIKSSTTVCYQNQA